MSVHVRHSSCRRHRQREQGRDSLRKLPRIHSIVSRYFSLRSKLPLMQMVMLLMLDFCPSICPSVVDVVWQALDGHVH